MTPLDPETLATLRRWRRRPLRRERRQAWLALAVVVVLHASFVLVLRQALQPPSPTSRENRSAAPQVAQPQVLQVRFIQPAPDRAAVAPPPPPPLPPARAAVAPIPLPARAPKVRERPTKDAMTIQLPAAQPTPRLYDPNGEARAPPPPSSSTSNYVSHALQGDTGIMDHDSPVKYHATRFANDWGKGPGPVTRALEKAVKKTTVKHTFHLPGGVRIHCAIAFAALAGGCGGDPPPPPPPKDGDERLSMAPAKPLVEGFNPAKGPGLAACIALYRAGKPLAYGCPIDTPTRAVDAAMKQEKAARERQDASAQGH